jgi:hypothetical protein
VAVAAGEQHCLALTSAGTVVAWGSDGLGQTAVPAGLTNAVAIAAGGTASLALKSDGTLIQWGSAPANPPAGLSGVAAIAMGQAGGFALKTNGTVIAWGLNNLGQNNVPTGLTNVQSIAAGAYHALALVGSQPPSISPLITVPVLSSNGFNVSLLSQLGRVYALEYKDSLLDSNWSALPLVTGNGTNLVLTDPTVSDSARFYRVRRW